jgi:hypothetical protein
MPEQPTVAPGSIATFFRQPPLAIALIPMLVTLWALTHRYNGFARDGELYAVQALARIQPSLSGDLYLQNTSQDQYTFFSPIYAWLIGLLGLQGAELLLFVTCSVLFLAASWILARQLSNEATAWLSVALIVVTIGYYGAYQIFSYSENYLTARSLAEALVVIAIACHFCSWRRLALMIAVGSMFIHPLMTLPGLLLLVYLWLPTWVAVTFAACGTLATLGIALTASMWPAAARIFTVMDPAWLEVVRERSQFLFLKYWTTPDWEITARPFVCLTLTALVINHERTRKLCLAAMLVGASGLALAYIACTIGPVAILLQGQAWRWIWITGFTSVLLIPPTGLQMWGDSKCGPLCALLLVLGWTYTGVDGLACAEGALILWLAREYISEQASRYLLWAAAAIGVILIATVLANCWTFASSPNLESGRESVVVARLREVFGLGIPAIVLVVPFWYWIRKHGTLASRAAASAAFIATSVVILPGSVKQLSTVGTRPEIEAFKDWRERIPANSSALFVPTTKSASFAWFTLGRPSYLSVDQSSGVVFSRATALEVRRRSEVLLPVSEPDWQILTQIEQEPAGLRKKEPAPRPLTAAALTKICADPQLGFVMAKENVGFDPLPHRHAGAWKDWNLYDCRHVRSEPPQS